MPERVVTVGLSAYVDEDGADRWGWLGERVKVHPDHVERFDSLNVAPEPEPDLEPDLPVEIHEAELPARNASLEAWQGFAEVKGVDVEGLTRNEIRDLFK